MFWILPTWCNRRRWRGGCSQESKATTWDRQRLIVTTTPHVFCVEWRSKRSESPTRGCNGTRRAASLLRNELSRGKWCRRFALSGFWAAWRHLPWSTLHTVRNIGTTCLISEPASSSENSCRGFVSLWEFVCRYWEELHTLWIHPLLRCLGFLQDFWKIPWALYMKLIRARGRDICQTGWCLSVRCIVLEPPRWHLWSCISWMIVR